MVSSNFGNCGRSYGPGDRGLEMGCDSLGDTG